MGFFTNIVNGMANYNRVVDESSKSRSILGSYARAHVGPAEKAIIGAVVFTTVLVVIKSAMSGNQQMKENFSGNNHRHQGNNKGPKRGFSNINYRHV